MAHAAHPMGRDGLPDPIKPRVIVRALAVLPGLLAGLSILILLQQMGKLLVTPGSVVLAALLGVVAGVLIPTLAHFIASRRLNGRIARARGTEGHSRGGA